MRLKIIEVNFSGDKNWIFKLTNGIKTYYVMDTPFYSRNDLNSPISKRELDKLDIGFSIKCEVEKIEDFEVVISMKY